MFNLKLQQQNIFSFDIIRALLLRALIISFLETRCFTECTWCSTEIMKLYQKINKKRTDFDFNEETSALQLTSRLNSQSLENSLQQEEVESLVK